MEPRAHVAWRAPVVWALIVLVVSLGIIFASMLDNVRGDLSPYADRAVAGAARGAKAGGAPAGVAREAAAPGIAARVLSPTGEILAEAGPVVAWQAGGPSWYARIATLGSGSWSARGGVVQAETSAGGRRVVTRAVLPAGTGVITTSRLLSALGLGIVVAFVAGLVVAWQATRRRRAIDRLAQAVRTIASGTGAVNALPGGELGPLSDATLAVREAMAEVQAVADAKVDTVEAVLWPLTLPAVARTPAGRELRNPAFDALIRGAASEDAEAVRATATTLLSVVGRPTARRVELSDGRFVEVESWSIPGGRIVVVSDRSEQERLRRLRRQLSGAAARHLNAPISEIAAQAADLYSHVPASSSAAVQRILSATDRLQRLVGSMLRGTRHDLAARPPSLAPVGVSGLLWAMAQKWDRSLRQHALRVELDVAPDLPSASADAALLQEILTELVENSAKYTPRGGTITLAAAASEEGTVVITVRDTGEGLERVDLPHATQPFYRGSGSEVLPGAGLGLGVARALSERIGGRLTVHPGPGGRVTLELAVAHEARELTASAAA